VTKAEKFKQLTCTEGVRNDLRGKSVRAATYTWATGLADFVLRIGSTAILARLVLPAEFGLVMMVMAVTAIADQFRDLGLSSATVQRKDISHEEVSNLFWVNFMAGVVIALIVCAISPLVSLYYKESRLTVLTCVLATNFIWSGLMVQHQALLTRQLKLGYTSGIRLASSFLSTILAVFLAWKGMGCWALVWREVARNVMLSVGMWFCLPWVPGLPSWKTDIRGLAGFGAHLSVANILATVSSSADRFFLGRYWGAGSVAIYRQAYQLLVIPMEQLLSPLFQVTQPGLCLLQADDSRFRRFFLKVLTVVCIATMPLSLFVAIYATEITRVILGRHWMDCAQIMLVLSLGAFIKSAVGWSAHVLIARGRSRIYMLLTVANSLTVIVLMVLGVGWGAIGIAYADVATTYLFIAPRLYYSFKDSPVTIGSFFSTIARPAIASMLMAVVLILMRASLPPFSRPISLALGSVVALVIFPAFWMLMPGGRSELMALASDVRSALQRKVSGKKTVEPVPATN
jgi:O-antigen/teichoic acid export membrane protein